MRFKGKRQNNRREFSATKSPYDPKELFAGIWPCLPRPAQRWIDAPAQTPPYIARAEQEFLSAVFAPELSAVERQHDFKEHVRERARDSSTAFSIAIAWPRQFRLHKQQPPWYMQPSPRYDNKEIPQQQRKQPGPKPIFGRSMTSTQRSRRRRARLRTAS
jgi:hypothetical protein